MTDFQSKYAFAFDDSDDDNTAFNLNQVNQSSGQSSNQANLQESKVASQSSNQQVAGIISWGDEQQTDSNLFNNSANLIVQSQDIQEKSLQENHLADIHKSNNQADLTSSYQLVDQHEDLAQNANDEQFQVYRFQDEQDQSQQIQINSHQQHQNLNSSIQFQETNQDESTNMNVNFQSDLQIQQDYFDQSNSSSVQRDSQYVNISPQNDNQVQSDTQSLEQEQHDSQQFKFNSSSVPSIDQSSNQNLSQSNQQQLAQENSSFNNQSDQSSSQTSKQWQNIKQFKAPINNFFQELLSDSDSDDGAGLDFNFLKPVQNLKQSQPQAIIQNAQQFEQPFHQNQSQSIQQNLITTSNQSEVQIQSAQQQNQLDDYQTILNQPQTDVSEEREIVEVPQEIQQELDEYDEQQRNNHPEQHLYHREQFYQYQDSSKITQVLVLDHDDQQNEGQQKAQEQNNQQEQLQVIEEQQQPQIDDQSSQILEGSDSHQAILQSSIDEYALLQKYQHPIVAVEEIKFEEQVTDAFANNQLTESEVNQVEEIKVYNFNFEDDQQDNLLQLSSGKQEAFNFFNQQHTQPHQEFVLKQENKVQTHITKVTQVQQQPFSQTHQQTINQDWKLAQEIIHNEQQVHSDIQSHFFQQDMHLQRDQELIQQLDLLQQNQIQNELETTTPHKTQFIEQLPKISNNQNAQESVNQEEQDQLLFEIFGEIVHENPLFTNQLRTTISNKIDQYLQKNHYLTKIQRSVWELLQFSINQVNSGLGKTSSGSLLPYFLETSSPFMSGQRNLIIEQLIDGANLSQFMEPIFQRQTDHQQNREMNKADDRIFDNEKGMQFESIARLLLSQSKDIDALVITAIFCNPKDRNQILGDYIIREFKPDHPLFVLMLILTDSVTLKIKNINFMQWRRIFQEESILERVSQTWKLHMSVILKNIDLFPGDVYGYLYMRILLGNLQIYDIQENEKLMSDLSVNYIYNILENLNPKSEESSRKKVLMAYYRSKVYKNLDYASQALEDQINLVARFGHYLEPRIRETQHFQDLMDSFYQLNNNSDRNSASGSGQNSLNQSMSQAVFRNSSSSDQKIGDQLAQGTQGLITGFKGFFKKVMDQATTIQQTIINEINTPDNQSSQSIKSAESLLRPQTDSQSMFSQQQININQNYPLSSNYLDMIDSDRNSEHSSNKSQPNNIDNAVNFINHQSQLESTLTQVQTDLNTSIIKDSYSPQNQAQNQANNLKNGFQIPQQIQPRFQAPVRARPNMPQRFITPVYRPPVQIQAQQNLQRNIQSDQFNQASQSTLKQTQQVEVLSQDNQASIPPPQGQINPFGMVPRPGPGGMQRAAQRGKPQYASLLHHNEDQQKQAAYDLNINSNNY
ncbi:UNKNOWN [Stylonychia lemnae]|uniref:Uncharacterized protein n=1 Tax=Stylonychia lemnae TaxID=5949 RepID=A0A078B0J8_STYLE|nr:UNKNOWN [Stylonychia lemnae]|eukprot:CDW86633.1 UNKNOWN [Stylonychia lemnae]